VAQDSVLVSWSGSMFEYLMPGLVMRAPAGSLLDQTARLVVRRQIGYGAERGVPWGVSESAYNVRDLEMTYQYSNFGVPGLGLRRGLGEDVVVAPYATGLAAMVDPAAAVRNFARLEEAGGRGAYGFYEALDYTASGSPTANRWSSCGPTWRTTRACCCWRSPTPLHDGVVREWFHAGPAACGRPSCSCRSAPRATSPWPACARMKWGPPPTPASSRRRPSGGSPRRTPRRPRTHLLSNGRYAVMLTRAGSGYSRWRDLAVTRWREDTTRDAGGTYVFLRDAQSGETWSAGYQPSGREPDDYEVTFSEDRAQIIRRDGSLTVTLDVIVSPEDDAEIRRVSLTNGGSRRRDVDVTSYAEVVLAEQAADVAHPAFSNLFVQTECVPSWTCCWRRAGRGRREEHAHWLATSSWSRARRSASSSGRRTARGSSARPRDRDARPR
jgi:cyclic beta-1,2-glucan synthetase